jgi:hypothetical protein
MTGPMLSLREYVAALGMKPACDVGRSVERNAMAAIAELERRARIEARRDAWLVTKGRIAPGVCCVEHTSGPADEDSDTIEHTVDLTVLTLEAAATSGPFTLVGSGDGPDYHTALEAALNAAGAL